MAISEYWIKIPEVTEHCYTPAEWFALKDAIMKACVTSEYIGLGIGLFFGALITYLFMEKWHRGTKRDE